MIFAGMVLSHSITVVERAVKQHALTISLPRDNRLITLLQDGTSVL